MRTRTTARFASTSRLIGISSFVVACGAQHAPATSPAPPAAPASSAPVTSAPAPDSATNRQSLTELEALEHDLALSEKRLLAELARQRTLASAEPAPPAPDPPRPGKAGSPQKPATAPPVTSKPKAELDDEDEPARAATIGAPCDLACRALASMRRAANGICAITGPSDGRCVAAQERVKFSAAEVESAGCVCRATP